MDKIVITSIYNDILNYYSKFADEPVIIYDDDIVEHRDFAYINFSSLDQMEDSQNSIKRSLTNHFAFLVKNVFYLDMKRFKAEGSHGSFFIYKKDAPIIKEILLRSVSQNIQDLIIGKWLNGTIKGNDYNKIVDLFWTLEGIIDDCKDVTEDVKNQWIASLKIALRFDFAYTMTELESAVEDIFDFTLPFMIDKEKPPIYDDVDYDICDLKLQKLILGYLNGLYLQINENWLQIVDTYLKSLNIDKIINCSDIPPIEVIKCKSVCELVYRYPSVFYDHPKYEEIKKGISYFISIDKEYFGKLEKRKQKDRERHIRNKFKDSK